MAGLVGGDMSGVIIGGIIAVIIMMVIFAIYIYFKARELMAQRKAADLIRKGTGKEGMPKGGNPKLRTRYPDEPPVYGGGEALLGLYPISRNGQANGSIKDVKDPHKIEE